MRTAAALLVLSATVAFLGGCASVATAPVTPVDTRRTTVVLLPDEDGHVGAVSVTTRDGSQKVDAAYQYTTVEGDRARPSALQSMGQEQVSATFEDVLKAQPPKPKSFVLYFVLDGTALAEESAAKLPEVLAAVRERIPTEVTIFGHTDRLGSEGRNLKLSAQRAHAVARMLRQRAPDLGTIEVQYFGSKVPLFPAARDVPEPRNRRVEIQIL